ncbi:MAG: hypothetical protein NTX03_01800 [Bacteroidetes bacterium]|nr:hypothetical protein [Bacteroidota bacterium]
MNTFKWMRFEKNMAEFVKEDKELAKKITDLTNKRADLEKIVTEYNEWYKENGKKRPPLKKN